MIQFQISDPAAMAAAANTFKHAGTAADDAMMKALHAIEGAGAPWGGDDPGQAFWSAYGAAASRAAANAYQVGYQVTELGHNTDRTVRQYDETEKTAAAASKEI